MGHMLLSRGAGGGEDGRRWVILTCFGDLTKSTTAAPVIWSICPSGVGRRLGTRSRATPAVLVAVSPCSPLWYP